MIMPRGDTMKHVYTKLLLLLACNSYVHAMEIFHPGKQIPDTSSDSQPEAILEQTLPAETERKHHHRSRHTKKIQQMLEQLTQKVEEQQIVIHKLAAQNHQCSAPITNSDASAVCQWCYPFCNERYSNWRLILAAKAGNLEKVRVELANKACPWTQDWTHNWYTPLHWAAALGHTAVAAELAKIYEGTDLKDKHGNTALRIAKQKNNLEMVKLLKAYQIPGQSYDLGTW
jgi:hypothetical protein